MKKLLLITLLLLLTGRSYAPSYESSETVFALLQQIPLDGTMREAIMEEKARHFIDKLNPAIPPDEQIVRKVYQILSYDLSPQGASPKPPTEAEDPLIGIFHGGDRAALVTWAGKYSSENREFLEKLADILHRDKEVAARIVAAEALGAAKWRPKDRTQASPIVEALKQANLRESSSSVHKAVLEALVSLHRPGAIHEGDPQIASAILAASAQSSDQQLKEQMGALRNVGLEKPHVRDVIQGQLHTILKLLTPELQTNSFYPLAKQRLSYLLEQIRKETENPVDPSQPLAIKTLWDPFLIELAKHTDPQIQMEALATQVRFNGRALGAVVENAKSFPDYPSLTEKQLSSQMGKGIAALGKLVSQASGDNLLEGINILGELANIHPHAANQLRTMAQARKYRNDESIQLAISAALVRSIEAGAEGPEIKNLVDAIIAKKPNHERLRNALKEAVSHFPPYRIRLLDLLAAQPKNPGLQELVSDLLTAPETVANLGQRDDRTINFLLKRAESENHQGPSTNALLQVNTEKLSKTSKRKVSTFSDKCGAAAATLYQ